MTREVLIVEDAAVTRRLLARAFRRGGWLVAEAATVAEGLAALERRPGGHRPEPDAA